MNDCKFIGYLARPVDLRYAQSGTPVANFSILVGFGKRDDNKSFFLPCVAFGRTAENLAGIEKTQLFVSGEIQEDKFEVDGQERRKTLLKCFIARVIAKNKAKPVEDGQYEIVSDSEIPF